MTQDNEPDAIAAATAKQRTAEEASLIETLERMEGRPLTGNQPLNPRRPIAMDRDLFRLRHCDDPFIGGSTPLSVTDKGQLEGR